MNTKDILSSKKTEHWLIIGIIVAFVVSLGLSAVNPNNPDNITTQTKPEYETRLITVEDTSYTVLVADTNQKRITGLSNRAILPDQIDGMLFIFDEPASHGIWMKDMNFTIDILWLDTDFTVVHRENSISPDTFPQSFSSPIPALYVLELPSIK